MMARLIAKYAEIPSVRLGSPVVFDDLTPCFSASASRALRSFVNG